MAGEPELPIPEVEPRPITYERFLALVPEKFELVNGYLFDPPYRHSTRERLLALLLTNEGLARAVGLAPPERWNEYIEQEMDEDRVEFRASIFTSIPEGWMNCSMRADRA